MNRSSLTIAGAILSVVVSTAAAASIGAQIVSVSCSATTACVVGKNTKSGPGVYGKSAAGTGGVRGASTGYGSGMYAQSQSGIGFRSAAASGNAIFAVNASSFPTVNASQSGSGSALAGTSKAAGNGVTATSQRGTALTASSVSGSGLNATSASYFGIFANSAQTYSLVAVSERGAGIGAYAGVSNGRTAGVYAVSETGTAFRADSTSGYGIVAEAQIGTGASGQSENGNGVDVSGSYIGAIGRAPASGYPITATSDRGTVFSVDGFGDVRYTGFIGTFARTARGNVLAYAANATTPTVEDTGSSALRAGVVRVALDPAFAHSIEGMGRYHIFLMPDGDTNGLFVAERDPAGFVVRETRGGRGSIAFDYRVVATTVGHGNERAAFVTERGGPRTSLRTKIPPAGPNGRAKPLSARHA